jgi:hypothetical protein
MLNSATLLVKNSNIHDTLRASWINQCAIPPFCKFEAFSIERNTLGYGYGVGEAHIT